MSSTRMRGLSDAIGSWKIIWIGEVRIAALVGRQLRDVLAAIEHAALGRVHDAGDHAAEGRLAAAGFADEADHLALRRWRGSTPSTARTTWSRQRPRRACSRSCRQGRRASTKRLETPSMFDDRARSCGGVFRRQRMEAAPGALRPMPVDQPRARRRGRRHRRAGSAARRRSPAAGRASDGVMPGICAQRLAAPVAAGDASRSGRSV